MIGNVSKPTMSDEELERHVVAYLNGFQRSPLRDIGVRVSNGHVTLRGRVGSFYEKQLCLGCLRRIAGVAELTDEIEVT